ncbi:MAG TPA: AtpZ/AtpI family protein [Gemmatimonadaceae bacterium]|nr:AtpZ/AtpI family protein [Gemmatimonadaceae bacterium]
MADQNPRNPLEPRGPSSIGTYAGLGLQFAIAILIFLFAGQWADKKLGTSPWLLIVGVFVGAAGAFYSIYRRLMADLHREEQAKKERKP